jgi:hypothetical protein
MFIIIDTCPRLEPSHSTNAENKLRKEIQMFELCLFHLGERFAHIVCHFEFECKYPDLFETPTLSEKEMQEPDREGVEKQRERTSTKSPK